MTPAEAAIVVEEEINNRVNKTKGQVGARLSRGSNQLRNAALTVLANPSPSSPGSPPGVQSGHLRLRWRMRSYGSNGSGVMAIESGVTYAGYLEHGTRKMAARSFVDKIQQTALPNIMAIFAEIGG